jgi:hypothetical protein
MTATITTDLPTLAVEAAPLELVEFDGYRNIHKGIRNELFAVTYAAGRVDPGNVDAVRAVATRWHFLSEFLLLHAEHEEEFVQPHIERFAPELAAQIIPAHRELEGRAAALEVLADRAGDACADERRLFVHRMYLGFAGFVSAYLAHQEFEELEVSGALNQHLSFDEMLAIETQITDSLTPEQTVQAGSLTIPAMNVEDRVEMVGGMKAGMAPEVFAVVWNLIQCVLTGDEAAQLAGRLGIA